MNHNGRIRIATRESQLALWQAHHIRDRLAALYPNLQIEILGMTTTGDQRLETSLAKIGGKGLFVKELEQALLDGRADLAVHSMKDVPVDMPEGFMLAAITAREEPLDAFVANRYAHLDELPSGAVVGTSSLRRQCQLLAHRPDLQIVPLRGNLQTRLRKLDDGQFDAIILAAAGLKRLGLGARIRATLPAALSLPAVGQGALGIECLSSREEIAALVAPLTDPVTRACVLAERAMSRRLNGSCQVPLGAYARQEGNALVMDAFVATPDGHTVISEHDSGSLDEAESLGDALASRLLARGAGAILAALAD